MSFVSCLAAILSYLTSTSGKHIRGLGIVFESSISYAGSPYKMKLALDFPKRKSCPCSNDEAND
jgi:hypothetical protein